MKTRITWFAIILVAVIVLGGCASSERHERAAPSGNAAHSLDHASTTAGAKPVPAHHETEPPRSSLAPTLDPDKFTGRQRDAYRAVREVPQLIAQLPCYCYCDRGFGHKSLHSCYVDDHAAHCAVCVDEVLEAYKLQQRGLSAMQIREQIIAQFGS